MRYNIYDKERLVGQDYQRDNGEWSHKWFRSLDKKFERGSWRGRAEGDNMENWKYVVIDEEEAEDFAKSIYCWDVIEVINITEYLE